MHLLMQEYIIRHVNMHVQAHHLPCIEHSIMSLLFVVVRALRLDNCRLEFFFALQMPSFIPSSCMSVPFFVWHLMLVILLIICTFVHHIPLTFIKTCSVQPSTHSAIDKHENKVQQLNRSQDLCTRRVCVILIDKDTITASVHAHEHQHSQDRNVCGD